MPLPSTLAMLAHCILSLGLPGSLLHPPPPVLGRLRAPWELGNYNCKPYFAPKRRAPAGAGRVPPETHETPSSVAYRAAVSENGAPGCPRIDDDDPPEG